MVSYIAVRKKSNSLKESNMYIGTNADSVKTPVCINNSSREFPRGFPSVAEHTGLTGCGRAGPEVKINKITPNSSMCFEVKVHT